MTDKLDNATFNKLVRPLNMKYRDIFGYIPRIIDYSCTRAEYLKAMESAIEQHSPLSTLLIQYQKQEYSKS